MAHNSPLRYPGGKSVLTGFLKQTIYHNKLQGCTYVEPYAGGAGAALNLLFEEHVDQIIINDADYRIYSIWKSILTYPNRFMEFISTVPLNIDQWKIQRSICANPHRHSCIKVGQAAFYMNRCNRSGMVMYGGPIGGFEQKGNWKIDARFNRSNLIKRISKIAEYKSRIDVRNEDALSFLKDLNSVISDDSYFVYLDPPYYVQGASLYLNHYKHEDHKRLSDFMLSKFALPWVMTYDNVTQIAELYKGLSTVPFSLRYSAFESREGKELLIYNKELMSALPPNIINC